MIALKLTLANDLLKLVEYFSPHWLMSQIPDTNSCQTNGTWPHHCVQVDVDVIWKEVAVCWVKLVNLESQNKKASKYNDVGYVGCEI